MRPRGLLLTIDYAPQTGGVPLLVSTIVEETRDLVDWRVITTAADETSRRSDEVQRASNLIELSRLALRSSTWLRAAEESFIVSAHVYLGPLAHAVRRLSGSPVSTLAYGRELVAERLHQQLALRTLTSDRRVVTISNHSEELLADLGVPPERRSWIAPEMRPQYPQLASPRPRHEDEPLRLVTVTRLAEGYKNLEVLLRSMAVLAPAGAVDRLTIVGDGPRRPALQHRIDVLGLARWVTLAGRLPDDELTRVLDEAHVGVFSSRHAHAEGGFEGFGIVIQELAAAGMPVIVGDAAGARDAARSDWAVMVDPDDVRGWVEAISCLANDEDRRHRLACRAHEWGAGLDSRAMALDYLSSLTGVGSRELRAV